MEVGLIEFHSELCVRETKRALVKGICEKCQQAALTVMKMVHAPSPHSVVTKAKGP